MGMALSLGSVHSARDVHTPVVAPTPTYLPAVSAAPTAVYGTAKMISAYAGASGRIQRISDDVEADVAFGSKFSDIFGSGIGLGTHNWKTLYDQTGNANHVTQTTKASQPAASSIRWGGMPQVHFDSSPLAGLVKSAWMSCATGPVTEKSAFTMFLLAAPNQSFNDNYLVCQPPGATTLSLFTQSTNVGLRGNNSSPFNTTRMMPRVQPQVFRYRGGPTGKQFGINGVTQLISTAPTAGTETGISFGHHFSTASFDGEFDFMAAVVYNATLSDADCLLVEAALYAQCGIITAANNLIIFDGDSRTEGSGHLYNQTWVRRVMNGLSKSAHGVNMGVGGQTLQAGMAPNVAARVAALYNGAYAKNIVVLGGPPINDFTNGRTAAQAWADMLTYVAGVHPNQQLIIGNCPFRSTETPPARTDYNALLLANYRFLKPGTGLVTTPTNTVHVDIAAVPSYPADYIDIVHSNDAGHIKWAGAFLPAIEAVAA